jgi:hypothetical protein
MLHVSAYQNHYRAPLLQKFKKHRYICNMQILRQCSVTNVAQESHQCHGKSFRWGRADTCGKADGKTHGGT